MNALTDFAAVRKVMLVALVGGGLVLCGLASAHAQVVNAYTPAVVQAPAAAGCGCHATTTYSPVVTQAAPVTTYSPVVVPYSQPAVYSQPVTPYSPVVNTYSPVVTTYSPPVTAYSPVVTYSPVAPAYYAAPAGVVRTKVYYRGEPVRNFFKSIAP